MSKENHGKVIILVAPSGAGKTTMAKRLLKDYPNIRFSVSATTRSPREDEIDGEDYFFFSEEEFKRHIEENDFLEWETYNSNRYGTLKPEVDKMVESGYFPLLDIEVKGALNIKKLYASQASAIFIQPPSLKELQKRLEKRGSETENVVQKRLTRAKLELQYATHFDYLVTNDDLNTAYTEIKQIIESFITP